MSPYRVWFQANSIIDRVAKSLLAAQVAFCRLHRNVPKQKLNLLQFAAGLVTQPGACPLRSCGARDGISHSFAFSFHDSPI